MPEKFHFFRPILAGATLRERLLACLGATLSIGFIGFICAVMMGDDPHAPLIVASVGASAVLMFAIPSSPLAQPWPIVGGNTISALVGVIVAQFIPDHVFATGVAVGGSLAVMSLTRCLHPAGGATALAAVLISHGAGIQEFLFPFVPVGLNSLVLVLLGVIFHRLFGRAYPHRLAAPVAVPPKFVEFSEQDIDAALASLEETFDIDRADLSRLLRQVELEAIARTQDGQAAR